MVITNFLLDVKVWICNDLLSSSLLAYHWPDLQASSGLTLDLWQPHRAQKELNGLLVPNLLSWQIVRLSHLRNMPMEGISPSPLIQGQFRACRHPFRFSLYEMVAQNQTQSLHWWAYMLIHYRPYIWHEAKSKLHACPFEAQFWVKLIQLQMVLFFRSWRRLL